MGNLSYSPNGKFLAATYFEREALVWDTATENRVALLTRNRTQLGSAVFSPDSKRLYTAGADQAITTWDTGDWRVLDEQRGHQQEIWVVAVSPDGKTLASGSRDETVRLWTAMRKPASHVLRLPENINGYRLSRDGRTLVTVATNQTLSLWDTENLTQLLTRPLPVLDFRRNLRAENTPILITSDRSLLLVGGEDGAVTSWSIETGKPGVRFTGLTNGVMSLNLSNDDQLIAACAWGRQFGVWDLRTGKLIHAFTQTPMETHSLNFSPDGDAIATTSSWMDGGCVWDLSSGKLRSRFSHHKHLPWIPEFSPDGRVLATSGSREALFACGTRKPAKHSNSHYGIFARNSSCFHSPARQEADGNPAGSRPKHSEFMDARGFSAVLLHP